MYRCPGDEDGRPLVTGVFVSPATAAVTQGRTKAFTATLSGINHGNSVKWSVSGSECENTSISAAGVLTVDTAEAAGTVLPSGLFPPLTPLSSARPALWLSAGWMRKHRCLSGSLSGYRSI